MSHKTETVTRALPDSPAGRQLAWWLTRLVEQGEGAEPCDWDRYAPALRERLAPLPTAEAMRDSWRNNAARFGEVEAVDVEQAADFEVTAVMKVAKGRRWSLQMTVEPEPPHRMTEIRIERRHDFKIEVREATEADAEVLADVERRCPIVMGETSMWFDRGADYFASTRLMEDCTVGLAHVDDAPAAVTCGAVRQVRVGGAMRRMMTVSHLRVLPEHQGKGLWGAVNKVLDKYWARVDGSNAYISVDNATMQHGFANTPNKWPQIVQRVQLDCRALAGPKVGRSAARAEAAAMARRLNAFHDAEEMFVPYSGESLSARLSRAPDLYGWDKLWVTDGAMVGVWPAGNALRTVTETRGVRTQSVRGVVLDYAFESGAEDEFEALLRAWCGHLAAQSMDTLSIFTSPASAGAAKLAALGREMEGFFMWSPGIHEPADADQRGLYVDAIYF